MISHVGTSPPLAQANAATVSPAWGAGQSRTVGNLLTLQATARGANAIATPAGWTAVGTEAVNGSTRARTFYRVATGADAAPVVTATAATRMTAQLNEWTGNAAAPLDASGSANGTTETLWQATAGSNTTVYGGLALGTWSFHSASAIPVTPFTNVQWTITNSDTSSSIADHALIEHRFNPPILSTPLVASLNFDSNKPSPVANWAGQIVVFKAVPGFLTVVEQANAEDIGRPQPQISWVGPTVTVDWTPRAASTGNPYTYYFVDMKTWKTIDSLPLASCKFSTRIGQPGSWSGAISITDKELVDAAYISQVTIPEETAIFIDKEGTLVYGGIIWARKSDDINGVMTLSGSDFWSYILGRVVEETLTFTNWDQIDIFKYMIRYAMGEPIVYSNGTASVKNNCLTGIQVYGDSVSGVLRSLILNWFDFPNIGQVLEKFALVANGFEFRCAPYWGYLGGDTGDPSTSSAPIRAPIPGIKIGHPLLGTYRSSNTPLIWTFPQGPIVHLPWDEDASDSAKVIWATGSGSDANKLYAKFPASGDPKFPRRDHVANFGQETNLATLQLYANQLGDCLSDMKIAPQITVLGNEDPVLTAYEDGDLIRYIVPAGESPRFPYGLDVIVRLVGRDVTVNEDGTDVVVHTIMPMNYIDVAYDINGNAINLTGR